MMRSTMLVPGLVLLIATPSPAGTYWVSPTGAATWGAAESDNPLSGTAACSLETASANAAAEDTVYLRGGDYFGQEIRPLQSGLADEKRIVFSNFEDEKPVVRESEGIFILKQSWITVRGIEFRSMKSFFRIFGSHYINIEHCVFDGRSKDADLWAGGLICEDRVNRVADPEDSTHNRVAHCRFFRWYWHGEIRDRGAIFDIGIISSKTDKSSHNLVEYNEMAYGGHHPFGVFSTNNVIRNNYFHNETDPDEWSYPGYRGSITQGSSAGRNLWEGNRFAFCDHAGLCVRSPKNIVRRNYFYLNAQGGIQVVSNAQFPDNKDAADDNRIYHNTFYRNGHRENYPGFQGGIYFANWRRVSPHGNVIRNNLFYDNRNGQVAMESRVDDPQIIDNNWDNDRNPLFVDTSDGGPADISRPVLRLQDSSPVTDQGAWLTTIVSSDGDGRSFQVEDAGFFTDGWGIIEGDLIQLEGHDAAAYVKRIDYASNTIVVDRAMSYSNRTGVALAYSGNAPDHGAFETGTADN